jgi:hypothetical protein
VDDIGIVRMSQVLAVVGLHRDGQVDGVLLVLPDTRHVRLFLAAAADVLMPTSPIPGRRALELLAAGIDPGGNSVIVL